MPMIPEALEAMLACARLGAVHSVVFGGFAANELAVRITDAKPKCVLAASCGIEPGRIVEYKPLLDKAISISDHKPEFCVVAQREQCEAGLADGRDFDWSEFVSGAKPADCIPVEGTHPAYILYTSGTTGQTQRRPSADRRPSGRSAMVDEEHLRGWIPERSFGPPPDVGWVVGHSYICYAPLLAGNTSVMFEGKPVGTPDAAAYWRVISEHGVRALFTAPTAFRAIKRADPQGLCIKDYDLSCLRTLFLAGERADPDTIKWAEKHLDVPVIDHWWQTETGWPIASNPVGIEMLPVKLGSPSVAMPGYDIRVLDDGGREVPRGTLGSIAIKLPLPPGNLADPLESRSIVFRQIPQGISRLLQHRRRRVHGRRRLHVHHGPHRRRHQCCRPQAIDRRDRGSSRQPCGCRRVRRRRRGGRIEGAASFGLPLLERRLRKTARTSRFRMRCAGQAGDRTGRSIQDGGGRSEASENAVGKILRGTIAKIADGETFKTPPTIDDPAILDEISEALAKMGYKGLARN